MLARTNQLAAALVRQQTKAATLSISDNATGKANSPFRSADGQITGQSLTTSLAYHRFWKQAAAWMYMALLDVWSCIHFHVMAF